MKKRFLVQIVLFASLFFLLTACGGGTEGTGGTGSLFKGQIKSEFGKPVSSALVVLEETGDSTRANHSGRFSVRSKINSKSVTLLVADKGDEAKATIDELPGTDVDVDLDLELNSKQKTLTVIKKSVVTKHSKKRRRARQQRPEIEVTPEEEATPDVEVEEVSEESEEAEEEIIEPVVEPTTGPTPIGTFVPNSGFTPSPSPTVTPTPVPTLTGTAIPTPTSTPII